MNKPPSIPLLTGVFDRHLCQIAGVDPSDELQRFRLLNVVDDVARYYCAEPSTISSLARCVGRELKLLTERRAGHGGMNFGE